MVTDTAAIKCCVLQPHINICGAIKQSGDYTIRFSVPFVSTLYPGDAPAFPTRCNYQERETMQNAYNLNLRFYIMLSRIESLLQTVIENFINTT